MLEVFEGDGYYKNRSSLNPLCQHIDPLTCYTLITHTAVGAIDTTGLPGLRSGNSVDAGAPGLGQIHGAHRLMLIFPNAYEGKDRQGYELPCGGHEFTTFLSAGSKSYLGLKPNR